MVVAKTRNIVNRKKKLSKTAEMIFQVSTSSSVGSSTIFTSSSYMGGGETACSCPMNSSRDITVFGPLPAGADGYGLFSMVEIVSIGIGSTAFFFFFFLHRKQQHRSFQQTMGIKIYSVMNLKTLGIGSSSGLWLRLSTAITKTTEIVPYIKVKARYTAESKNEIFSGIFSFNAI